MGAGYQNNGGLFDGRSLCLLMLGAVLPCTLAMAEPAVNPDSMTVTSNAKHLPSVIAILPFDNATDEPGIAEEARRAFYNHFSSKPYSDIELLAIDDKILSMARVQPGKPGILDFGSLCQSLGCTGVITGRVTEFNRIYAGVYSELAATAEIRMLDVQSGETVFAERQRASFKEGSFSLNPIGLAIAAVSTAFNLRDAQRVRMVSELGYKLAKAIPDPPGGIGSVGPRIEDLLTNAGESPFGLGRTLQVAVQSEPGALAFFAIGDHRQSIPMQEKSPGVYVGQYRVQDKDDVRMASIRVRVRARNGLENHWYDMALVTLDTAPPAVPTGLVARSLPGQVELNWEEVASPDLAAYKVLRSDQPLSGYSPVGQVETHAFTDRGSSAGNVRYYRIVAVDRAGNESEPSRPARGRLLPEGFEPLKGPIDIDRELAGNFLVEGDLEVRRGVTLRLLPATRLAFAPDASLIIRGGLVADANAEPVTLTGRMDAPWKGLRVEQGSIGLRGFSVAGATTCLRLERARGVLESGQLNRCGTGISVEGDGSVSLVKLTVSDNKTGIRLARTDASLNQNTIANNVLGVEMEGFVGEFRDNSLLHNDINLRAETGTLLEANFWGTLDPSLMRVDGVVVSEALNRRPPEGRAVPVRINTYAHLSPAIRQDMVTSWLVEAGRLFRAKNFGRAAGLFEQAIAAAPSTDAYYFAALCHQEMQDEVRAMDYLREGIATYPEDPALRRALGMLHYQRGEEAQARVQLQQALRLAPGDRQAAFVLERLGAGSPPRSAHIAPSSGNR